MQVTIGVNRADIACGEPAVDQWTATFFTVIATHDPRALDVQIAIGFAVPRQRLARVTQNFHVNAKHCAALFQPDFGLVSVAERRMLVFKRADGAERTHFCHTPGMQHFHVVVVVKRLDHRGRAGRAADDRARHGGKRQPQRLDVAQQHLPHGGHAGRQCDFFKFHQLINRLAVHGGAGKHQLCTGQSRCVGNAPSVDVKHRHHWQDRVFCGNVDRVWQRRCKGMQRAGPVAVQRGFRVAGGAAGVAHAGCGVFIERRPVVHVGLRANPGFVADQVGNARISRQLVSITQCHKMLDGAAACMHRLHQRQKAQVKTQHLVFGMVGNPGDLVGMQARVDGVQHTA